MQFGRALVSGFLFAFPILAIPHKNTQPGLLARAQGSTDASYTAGAILTKNDKTFETVGTTFVVPNVMGDGTAAIFWVGLDGLTCSSSLRVGIEFVVSNDGPSFTAWSQFNSGTMNTYDIDISPGDLLGLRVTTFGFIWIKNYRSKQSRIDGVAPAGKLCGQTGQWIIEAASDGSTFYPLANFGEVAFHHAMANTSTGGTYTPADGARVINIEENNREVTSTSISGSSVRIKYV